MHAIARHCSRTTATFTLCSSFPNIPARFRSGACDTIATLGLTHGLSSPTFMAQREDFAVLVTGNQLVLAGGVNAEGEALAKVLVWDLCEKRWTSWSPLPHAIVSGCLVHYVGRAVLYGGWVHRDGAIRPSVNAYSINPECPVVPWDTHHTSPVPLCLSGIATLGNNVAITGGCHLSNSSLMSSSTESPPESGDDECEPALLNHDQVAVGTTGASLDDSACSLANDSLIDDRQSATSSPQYNTTRPDPVEDIPQRDCYFWDETSRQWLTLPKLQHPCSQPCLLYSKGRLICFGGKNEEGVRTLDIQVLVLHNGVLTALH